MFHQYLAPSKSVNWTRSINAFMAIVLILSVISFIPAPASAARAQPALLVLASEQPDTTVGVIVQKIKKDEGVETLVRQLGGRIVKELSVINAFAAEMPAGAIPILAQDTNVRWVSLDAPMISSDASDEDPPAEVKFTAWAAAIGNTVSPQFVDAGNIVDEIGIGPDDLFGYGGKGKTSFTGFTPEITPGYAIQKVEAVLYGYVPEAFDKRIKLKVYIAGKKAGETQVESDIFDDMVGATNAGPVYVDLSGIHAWQWADFTNMLELVVEHQGFSPHQVIYYDSIGLRITSVPGNAEDSDIDTDNDADDDSADNSVIDTSNLATAFPFAVRAPEVWNEAPAYLQGNGITVAVVDSGINKTKALKGRTIKNVNFNAGEHTAKDKYGHGTFVATILAADNKRTGGRYIGIAPEARLLNVRVTDDRGMSYESDVVEALEWVLNNKDKYNIRVVNLSLNSTVVMSYHDSPLDAAVELLWFNGIVVVVSAGNNGTDVLYPPANDPFVITVGATDDMGTPDISDDQIASFSAYGVTLDGHLKPDLVAPGRNIVAYLPKNKKLEMSKDHPTHAIDIDHFRMSGTSVSAPIVAGAVALLLQDEPTLTPDQVKYRLMATANTNWLGYDPLRAGAGYLDIYAAVHGTTTELANQGIMPHQLLAKMALIALWANQNGGATIDWSTIDWAAVNWDQVDWNSVNWSNVDWSSVDWTQVNWGQVNWNNVNWNNVNWNNVNWSTADWTNVNWSSMSWTSTNWNSDFWED